MSGGSRTRQGESLEGEGEEGGGGGAAEVVRQGGDEVDGVARCGEDDRVGQQGKVARQPNEQQQEEVHWYKRKIRKAGNLFLLPFRRIKKFYVRRCRSAYYYYGDDPGGCCCRCFRPPPAISPPRLRNPGNPGRGDPSSYDFVKFLIESNDFYAPQCNVHGGSLNARATPGNGEAG